MAIARRRAAFLADMQTVWNTVTSLDAYAWRSDVSRIEIVSENRFIEYSKEGIATTFTVTLVEPCKRWEFDLENDKIKGHWTGLFTQAGKQTVLDFTENVVAKKLLMRPFVKAFLKKQQAQYFTDLQKALQC